MAGKPPTRPDFAARSPAGLAAIFDHFGRVEVPQLHAPLYQMLACAVARDPQLLDIAARAPAGQPPPNLLFGAVHYLLLRGAEHPLRRHYPSVGGALSVDGAAAEAFTDFRDFCLLHREALETLVSSRRTQTNVIQRCSVLLPAFAAVWQRGGRRPLALIEIGTSAGLNLQWDHFGYRYQGPSEHEVRTWGDPSSAVTVECAVRGNALPDLPATLPVAWRMGIDLAPLDLDDADAVDWLRALVWTEHVGRHERLAAAIDVARLHPPQIVAANAAQALPEAIAAAPTDATLCVFGTHTLYQFDREALRALFRALQAGAGADPVFFVSCEGTGERWSDLRLTTYRGAERSQRDLARCNPHGRWIEWLGEG